MEVSPAAPAAPTAPAKPSKGPNDTNKKIKNRKKKKGERKTELANPWGQFLRQKHLKEGKFDFKKACEEWKNMQDEDKAVYRKKFEDEKTAMGGDYRARNVQKGDKSNKTPGNKKGRKINQPVEVPSKSIQLLAQVESLDSEIDKIQLEVVSYQEQLCGEKVQLALTQYKLKEKVSECENVIEKYKTLLCQHRSCPFEI